MDGSSWQSQSLMLVLRYEHERFVSLLREIDDDDTGLSKRDFRAAVTSLGSKIGLNPPREVIDAAFSAFDARSAGLLSLSDVSASLTRPLNASPVAGIPQRVANAFNFFDRNGSGFLDYRELKTALQHLGIDLSSGGSSELLMRYDDKPDGKLDVNEFGALVQDLEAGVVRASAPPPAPTGGLGLLRPPTPPPPPPPQPLQQPSSPAFFPPPSPVHTNPVAQLFDLGSQAVRVVNTLPLEERYVTSDTLDLVAHQLKRGGGRASDPFHSVLPRAIRDGSPVEDLVLHDPLREEQDAQAMMEAAAMARLESQRAIFEAEQEALRLMHQSVPQHVSDAFRHFDANGSGYLDYRELKSALKYMGFDLSTGGAMEVVRRYDDRPDGKLDVKEFAELIADLESGAIRATAPTDGIPERIVKAFRYFDQNGSGYLDYRELKNALQYMGFDLSTGGAMEVVKRYDDKPDGKLDVREFAALITDLEAGVIRDNEAAGIPERIVKAFRYFDQNNSGYLDYRELKNALKYMGFDHSTGGAKEIVMRYDDKPDGKLDIKEWAELITDLESGAIRANDGIPPRVVKAFRYFDQNGSGFLDYRELRNALKYMGFDLSSGGAKEVVMRYDDNPDGKLDVRDFAALIADLESGVIRESPTANIPQHVLNAFLYFDKNRTGYLDYRELKKALNYLGINLSAGGAKEVVMRYDDQPDGKLDVQEFAALVADLEAGMIRAQDSGIPEHVVKAFRHFDRNGTGYLDFRELKQALKYMGLNLSSASAKEIVMRYDDRPDGKLDIREFAELVADLESGVVRANSPPTVEADTIHQMLRQTAFLNGEDDEAIQYHQRAPSPRERKAPFTPPSLRLTSDTVISEPARLHHAGQLLWKPTEWCLAEVDDEDYRRMRHFNDVATLSATHCGMTVYHVRYCDPRERPADTVNSDTVMADGGVHRWTFHLRSRHGDGAGIRFGVATADNRAGFAWGLRLRDGRLVAHDPEDGRELYVGEHLLPPSKAHSWNYDAPRQVTCQLDLGKRRALGFAVNGGPLVEAVGLNLPPAVRVWASFVNKDDAIRLHDYKRSASKDQTLEGLKRWKAETEIRAEEAHKTEAEEAIARARTTARADRHMEIAAYQLEQQQKRMGAAKTPLPNWATTPQQSMRNPMGTPWGGHRS